MSNWRTEIRTFCNDIRQKLEDVRSDIDRIDVSSSPPNEQNSAGVSVFAAATPMEEPQTSRLIAPASAKQLGRTGDYRDRRITSEPTDDSTVERLQSVRRQLEEMLTTNQAGET